MGSEYRFESVFRPLKGRPDASKMRNVAGIQIVDADEEVPFTLAGKEFRVRGIAINDTSIRQVFELFPDGGEGFWNVLRLMSEAGVQLILMSKDVPQDLVQKVYEITGIQDRMRLLHDELASGIPDEDERNRIGFVQGAAQA